MSGVRIEPSPFDRLDPVAHSLRWWLRRLADVGGAARRTTIPASALEGGTDRLSGQVTVALGETDGFLARTILPNGHAEAHRRALDLRLADLAPVARESVSVCAVAVDRDSATGTTYALAMARRERLDELEALARGRGARSVAFSVEGEVGPLLVSPSADRKARVSLGVNAGIAILVVFAAAVAVSSWTSRINAEIEMLAGQERAVRRAAVAAEATRKASEVSRELIERGVFSRRGSAVLDTLAQLNTATPDRAWWTRVRWSPEEITLTAQSPNATQAMAQLSAAAKGWSVELSGPLAAAPEGGTQTFDIVLRPRREVKQ